MNKESYEALNEVLDEYIEVAHKTSWNINAMAKVAQKYLHLPDLI